MSYIHKQHLILDIARRMGSATNYKEMYEVVCAAINDAPTYSEAWVTPTQPERKDETDEGIS